MKNSWLQLCVVSHIYNPNTWEAEAGGFYNQFGLQSEILFQNTANTQTHTHTHTHTHTLSVSVSLSLSLSLSLYRSDMERGGSKVAPELWTLERMSGTLREMTSLGEKIR
jgi:hypothetical protein